MSVAIKLPALGESVVEGTVARWLVAVGDRVEIDQPLCEVTTDKVDAEIPAPTAGIVEQILVEEGEVVEVGAELALLSDPSDGDCLEGPVDNLGLMEDFVSAVANNDPQKILTEPEETLKSHRIVFAAERSRREGRIVTL